MWYNYEVLCTTNMTLCMQKNVHHEWYKNVTFWGYHTLLALKAYHTILAARAYHRLDGSVGML